MHDGRIHDNCFDGASRALYDALRALLNGWACRGPLPCSAGVAEQEAFAALVNLTNKVKPAGPNAAPCASARD